jgi:D-alanyl-lipoteichoic acid acyltransferase DltB (MBOAT superfamily)
VYNSPHDYKGLSLIIATVFFSFQIFCDFSGYSDMAIGAAKIMGFKLMKNFDRPYHSRSIHEFWSRWHISLSTWFRDYLYISLGGNRVSVPRWYLNLFLVFLISGLWHGANFTFIIWGALHGFYLVFALVTKKPQLKLSHIIGLDRVPRFNNLLQIFVTFVLATFAWIFFRANNVSDAFYVIKNSFTGLAANARDLMHHVPLQLNLGSTNAQIAVGIAAIVLMEAIHIFQNRHSMTEWIRTKPIYIRWSIYYAVFFLILFFGVYENRQFIYFQF